MSWRPSPLKSATRTPMLPAEFVNSWPVVFRLNPATDASAEELTPTCKLLPDAAEVEAVTQSERPSPLKSIGDEHVAGIVVASKLPSPRERQPALITVGVPPVVVGRVTKKSSRPSPSMSRTLTYWRGSMNV